MHDQLVSFDKSMQVLLTALMTLNARKHTALETMNIGVVAGMMELLEQQFICNLSFHYDGRRKGTGKGFKVTFPGDDGVYIYSLK